MERATPAMNAVLRLREGFKRVRNCASSATAAASSSRSSWYFCGNDTTLAESESTTTEYNFFRPPTTSTRSFDSTNHHHRRHLAFCNAASSLCTYDGGDEGGENDNDNDNDSLATKTTYSSFVALGRESSSSSTTKPDLSQSKAELPIVMMGYLDDPATVATTDGVDDNDDDAMYGKYHYDTYGEETATRTRTAMATATMTTLMTSDNNGKTQTQPQPQPQTETDNDSYSYHSNEYNLETFGLNIVGLVTDVVTSRASWSSHSSSDGDTYSTNNHNDNHTSIKNTTTTTTTTNNNNNNHTKTKNTDTDSNTNKSPDPDGRWHADFGLTAIETESRDGTLFKQRQHDKDNTGMEPPGAVSSSSGGGGGCDSDTMTRELPSFGKSREFRSFGSNGTNNNNGGGGSSSNSNNSNSSGDSCSFKPTFITPDEDQQLEQEHTRYSYLTRTTSSSSSRSVATYDSATLCDGDFRLVSLSSLTSSSSAVHQQQQKQKQKQQQQQQQQAGADTISGHDPTVAKDNNGVGQGQPKQQRSRTSKRPTVHAFSSFFTKKTISSSSQLLGGGSYKPIAA